MPSYFCLNSQLLILIRQNWLSGISMVLGSYLVLVVPLLIVMFCVYNAERKRIAQQEVRYWWFQITFFWPAESPGYQESQ